MELLCREYSKLKDFSRKQHHDYAAINATQRIQHTLRKKHAKLTITNRIVSRTIQGETSFLAVRNRCRWHYIAAVRQWKLFLSRFRNCKILKENNNIICSDKYNILKSTYMIEETCKTHCW